MTDYFLDESEDGYGTVFVPRGPWLPSYRDLLMREGIHAVRLSASVGWRGSNVDFLRELDFLRAVEIYSWKVRDASVLSSLQQLRLIGLECDLKTSIEFGTLSHLEVLKARWTDTLAAALECDELKHVNLVNWPEPDLQPLCTLRKLERLHLTSRKLSSLHGVSSLRSLQWLDLSACTVLGSLDELRSSGISRLEFGSCKAFRSVSPIGTMKSLRRLALDDCGKLDSLVPIAACKNLEALSFLGSTRVVDGDLAFISHLPKLKELRFAPRRHYNAKRRDLI